MKIYLKTECLGMQVAKKCIILMLTHNYEDTNPGKLNINLRHY